MSEGPSVLKGLTFPGASIQHPTEFGVVGITESIIENKNIDKLPEDRNGIGQISNTMSIEELNEVKAENSGITLHSHLLAGVCNEITIDHVKCLKENLETDVDDKNVVRAGLS